MSDTHVSTPIEMHPIMFRSPLPYPPPPGYVLMHGPPTTTVVGSPTSLLQPPVYIPNTTINTPIIPIGSPTPIVYPIQSPYPIVGSTPPPFIYPTTTPYPTGSSTIPVHASSSSFIYPTAPVQHDISSSDLLIDLHIDPFHTATAPSKEAVFYDEEDSFEMQIMNHAHKKEPDNFKPTKNGSIRCKKCALYYIKSKNHSKACIYHPGKYRTPPTVTSIMMSAGNSQVWSCCKNTEKTAIGCKISSHSQDKRTTKILTHFERQISLVTHTTVAKEVKSISNCAEGTLISFRDDNEEKKEEDEENIIENKENTKEGKRSSYFKHIYDLKQHPNKSLECTTSILKEEKFVVHTVRKFDTLSGVAIRYGVMVTAIKRANNLITNSIFEHKTLIIPNPTKIPDEAELKALEMPKNGRNGILESRFRAKTSTDIGEAKYYLSSNDYNMEKALKEYNVDIEWEKSFKSKK